MNLTHGMLEPLYLFIYFLDDEEAYEHSHM